MWILLSVLMIGVPGSSTNLVNLQGKWTVGLEMDGLLDFDQYSILWRPWKTVMIGIEGNGWIRKYEDDYDWRGFLGIELYKYFRAHNSLSPFVSLLPKVYGSENYYYEGTNWEHYLELNSGVEYFFALFMKQVSLKLKTHLAYATFDGYNYNGIRVSFYLPTGGSLSTWLCFHF